MTTIAASAAAASIITEVSIRQPCQVTITSPGRSASQATPSARMPTAIRKVMTRVIAMPV